MEKIAVISDIHGNIPALEAVLADIGKRGISRVACLGDVVGKGPDPAIAVDMMRENCQMVVKGNWDYLVSEECSNEVLAWHYGKLGNDRIEYLKALPTFIQFHMSGRLVRLCHAAPDDVFHRVWATASIEEKRELFSIPEGEIQESDVVGYGDIHEAYLQNINDKTLFNSGSVGNPLDMTQASYAIMEGEYDSKETSSFSISLIKVPYDIEKSVALARNSEMPDVGPYVNELRTSVYRGLVKK